MFVLIQLHNINGVDGEGRDLVIYGLLWSFNIVSILFIISTVGINYVFLNSTLDYTNIALCFTNRIFNTLAASFTYDVIYIQFILLSFWYSVAYSAPGDGSNSNLFESINFRIYFVYLGYIAFFSWFAGIFLAIVHTDRVRNTVGCMDQVITLLKYLVSLIGTMIFISIVMCARFIFHGALWFIEFEKSMFLNKFDTSNLDPRFLNENENIQFISAHYVTHKQSSYNHKFWAKCIQFIQNSQSKSYSLTIHNQNYQSLSTTTTTANLHLNTSQDRLLRICCINYIVLKHCHLSNDSAYGEVNQFITDSNHTIDDNFEVFNPNSSVTTDVAGVAGVSAVSNDNNSTKTSGTDTVITNYADGTVESEEAETAINVNEMITIEKYDDLMNYRESNDFQKKEVSKRITNYHLRKAINNQGYRDTQFSHFIEDSAYQLYSNIETLNDLYENSDVSYYVVHHKLMPLYYTVYALFGRLYIQMKLHVHSTYIVALLDNISQKWKIQLKFAWIICYILTPIYALFQVLTRIIMPFGYLIYFIIDIVLENNATGDYSVYYLFLVIVSNCLMFFIISNFFQSMKTFYYLFYICPLRSIDYQYGSFDWVIKHYNDIIASKWRKIVFDAKFGSDIATIIELYLPKFERYYVNDKKAQMLHTMITQNAKLCLDRDQISLYHYISESQKSEK